MKTILAGDPFVKAVLGSQRMPINGEKTVFRLNRFASSLAISNGVLLYNGLTKEFVLLSNNEFSNLTHSIDAISRWFCVPKDFDEINLIEELRILSVDLLRHPGIDHYTIFTTTECNACCPYCFELSSVKRSMSKDTATAVSDYILNTSSKIYPIRIEWFGGEPLLNCGVIDHICKRLRENGLPYVSSITTNGFLFTDEMVKQAKENWNLKKVQITLDGTQDVYNMTKKYLTDSDNPFEVVLNNIQKLIRCGIRVLIRMNISEFNGIDLKELAKYLISRFASSDCFSVYCVPLYAKVRGEKQIVDAGDYSKTTTYIKELLEVLYNGGLYKKELQQRLRTHRCGADTDNAIVIFPGGELGKCNHYLDSMYIGSVESNSGHEAEKAFYQRYPILEKCRGCALYPECIRPQLCDGASNSCDFEQIIRTEQLKYQMLYEYRKYVKSKP